VKVQVSQRVRVAVLAVTNLSFAFAVLLAAAADFTG
jgi:hypothetical protein